MRLPLSRPPPIATQQVEAGTLLPRGPLYKAFVSDAESYKQYGQPARALVGLFLIAFRADYLSNGISNGWYTFGLNVTAGAKSEQVKQ